MIIIFGPPGAGKSMQGQMLAADHDWRWLSTGQLFRDSHDPEVHELMRRGELINDELTNKILANALSHIGDVGNVILDGYPRHVGQAEWLLNHLKEHNQRLDVVVILKVSDQELASRLQTRGRADDNQANIAKRSSDYEIKTKPVLDYLRQAGVIIKEIDGEGSVETVHERLESTVQACLPK